MPDDAQPDLPINPAETEASKRRIALGIGHDQHWWVYESENDPGYTDRNGRTYRGPTYTIVLPGEGDLARRERVLLPDEVLGYVTRAADEHHAMHLVAFRPGLIPPE